MKDYTGKKVGAYLSFAGILAHSGYLTFTAEGMDFRSMGGGKQQSVKYSEVVSTSNSFSGFLPIAIKLDLKDGSSVRFGFGLHEVGAVREFIRSKVSA